MNPTPQYPIGTIVLFSPHSQAVEHDSKKLFAAFIVLGFEYEHYTLASLYYPDTPVSEGHSVVRSLYSKTDQEILTLWRRLRVHYPDESIFLELYSYFRDHDVTVDLLLPEDIIPFHHIRPLHHIRPQEQDPRFAFNDWSFFDKELFPRMKELEPLLLASPLDFVFPAPNTPL